MARHSRRMGSYMTVVHMPKSWVKISRDGERFWLREIRTEGDGTKTGVVDNELLVAPYKRGERIEFREAEVIDAMATRKGQEYGK